MWAAAKQHCLVFAKAALALGPLQQLLGCRVAGILTCGRDRIELPSLDRAEGLLQVRSVLDQLQKRFCRQDQALNFCRGR